MHGDTKVSLAHIHVFHMHIRKTPRVCTSVPFIVLVFLIKVRVENIKDPADHILAGAS